MSAPYRASALDRCDLPPRFAAELAAELEPGERVLWAGLPPRADLVKRALGELLLPLVFNGFVLLLADVCSRESGVLGLSAVPLLALGLPLFATPIGALRAIRTTFHAVTDRRALVFDADAIRIVCRHAIASADAAKRIGQRLT